MRRTGARCYYVLKVIDYGGNGEGMGVVEIHTLNVSLMEQRNIITIRHINTLPFRICESQRRLPKPSHCYDLPGEAADEIVGPELRRNVVVVVVSGWLIKQIM